MIFEKFWGSPQILVVCGITLAMFDPFLTKPPRKLMTLPRRFHMGTNVIFEIFSFHINDVMARAYRAFKV